MLKASHGPKAAVDLYQVLFTTIDSHCEGLVFSDSGHLPRMAMLCLCAVQSRDTYGHGIEPREVNKIRPSVTGLWEINKIRPSSCWPRLLLIAKTFPTKISPKSILVPRFIPSAACPCWADEALLFGRLAQYHGKKRQKRYGFHKKQKQKKQRGHSYLCRFSFACCWHPPRSPTPSQARSKTRPSLPAAPPTRRARLASSTPYACWKMRG